MAKRRRKETDLRIVAEPGKIISRKEFLEDYDLYAISLDGHCRPATFFSSDKLHVNLNHHSKREAGSTDTLATCAQAFRLVRDQELFIKFTRNGRPYGRIYINDCDQDVCLATFILLNPSLVNRPKLRYLVEFEERLDTTAGLYVLDKKQSKMIGEVAWIFQPYAEFRTSGALYKEKIKPSDLVAVINEVHARIRAYLFGRQKKIKVERDFDYLVENGPEGFAIVREIGMFARLKMAEEGITAYAILKGQSGDIFHWSAGKKSPFVDKDLQALYDACNKEEGISEDDPDRWGGGTTRGGSPRIRGSKLNPERLAGVAVRIFG